LASHFRVMYQLGKSPIETKENLQMAA
jgi:hypothetical protein